LDKTKLNNHHFQVKIVVNGGSRIGQTIQQVGKSNSDIIVVHTGTSDIKSSNPQELSDYIINTVNEIPRKMSIITNSIYVNVSEK